MPPSRHDTIAALATPVGTAALAIVRVSGLDTKNMAATLFGRPPPPRRATHFPYRDRGGERVDDVVGTFFAAPHSYTGEDALEITCHGNPFIAQRILEDLLDRGCRLAEPGEFTQRAFLNGRMDLSQAEAVMDVIHARTMRALAAANAQLRGALGRQMNELTESLLAVLARIEAYIDFPEEDLPAEDRTAVARDLAALAAQTGRLLATSHYGEVLRDGIKTVIVGEPNVGKSSLLNRLVGRERALVSPEPGTTRDFIVARRVVGPHWLRLIDTAGLNPNPAALERLGMVKTHERLAEADLILVVLDASGGGRPPADIEKLIRKPEALVVWNKVDLPARPLPLPAGVSALHVSALTGSGIPELIEAVTQRADAFQTTVGDEQIAINARHAHALSTARDALTRAQSKLQSSGPMELLASDLRSVLAAYGEIVGKVDNERMLDHLFAKFCIGK